MPTPKAVEKALAAGWPALEIKKDGNWQARFANGFTGRSNAIQSFDTGDVADARARIAALARLYRERGLRPAFKVTPLTGSTVVAALDALGWTPWHESLVLTAPVPAASEPDAEVRVLEPTDAQWLSDQHALQGYDAASMATFAALMERIGPPAAGLVLMREGMPVAAALGVVRERVGMAFNVVTASAHRRQGLGLRIMRAWLAFCARAGAEDAAIQVLASNAPAVGLYQALGFTAAYPYHYRRAPETAA